MKKNLYTYIPLGVLALLVITNPSPNAFKDYLGIKTTVGIQRRGNLFICSYYEYEDKYFAIAGNFFQIKTDSVSSKKDTVVKTKIVSYNPYEYKLWNALNSSNYYKKPFDNFKKEFSNIDNVKKLYNALHSSGYYTKTNNEFINQFFLKSE